VRECGWYNFPSDDYYSDIDGDWKVSSGIHWRVPVDDYYVDLILGRWPVDNSDDVQLLLSKLQLYECPEEFPEDFARKALFIGGSDVCINEIPDGKGAVYEEYLIYLLDEEEIIDPNGNLDSITEFYLPQDGSCFCEPFGEYYDFASQEILSRPNALDELDAGYNLIIHFDHSGTHQIGAAQQASPGEYIYEYDFQSLSNTGEPSILWTAGCWPGHFEGADCFAEAGLLTPEETGLVAVIANARSGVWHDWMVYYPFVDALYPFGWVTEPSPTPVCGVSYIGEAYRYSMNFEHEFWGQTNYRKSIQNLFGDPTMFVWRDDPDQLAVETVPSIITAGTSTDITVFVTNEDEGNAPVGAMVCLYKDGDLFSMKYADAVFGTVTFNNVEVAHTGVITVTAVKRQDIGVIRESVVNNFIPAETRIRVYGSSGALVNLEGFTIDDDNSGQSEGNGDGVANPGETIELDLDVKNLGMTAATHLWAQLSVVSGDVLIEDDFVAIGFLAGGTNLEVQDAFVVSIPPDLDENEPVQLEVNFIYDQGSWESPCDFTVLVDDIEIPLHSIDAEYDGVTTTTTVEITNILVVNTGIGAVEDVEITLDNFSDGAVFTTDVSVVGDISPGTSAEALSLFVTCDDPPEEWQDPYHTISKPGCTFEIIATDAYDREIYSEVIIVPNYDLHLRPVEPEGFEAVEAGQDYINVEWDGTTGFDGSYYLYVKENGTPTWIRSNLLPIPVAQYMYSELESATFYDLAVSAVDEYGQESPVCEMENTASTVCTMLEGWPVQLEGSPGTGPVVADIDGDDEVEIIIATDYGHVYIIDVTGDVQLIDNNDEYAYTGCAVGDVYPGGYLEIVTCGFSFDMKKGAVFIYQWNDQIQDWTTVELLADEASSGEELHQYFSVPVLLQSDCGSVGTLEIALRTYRGNFTGSASNGWLYLWEYSSGNWDSAINFPICLEGAVWDYTPPVVSDDIDGDGSVELIVSSGTERIACIETEDGSTIIWDLSGLPEETPYWNLGQCTFAYIEYQSDDYLVGIARHNLGGNHNYGHYIAYCWNATDQCLEWYSPQTDYITAFDAFGNNGGPALGDVNGDGSPDVVKQFAFYYGDHPDHVRIWDISDGTCFAQTDIDHSIRQEDSAIAPVTIGGSLDDGMAVSFGYSTCGFGMSMDNSDLQEVQGFPYWSEDLEFAASCFADIDNDNLLEILFCDNSGLLSILDWNLTDSSGGWPMYQHDPWRTGNYNIQLTDADGGKLDFNLLGVEKVIPERRLDENTSITLLAEVEVTGSGVRAPVIADIRTTSASISNTPHAVRIIDNPSAEIAGTSEEQSRVRQPSADAVGYNYDSVAIALFSGNREITSTEFPLCDGTHVIRLTIPETGLTSDNLVVRVDPDNEYPEAAEDNNARATGNLTDNAPSVTRVYLQSPCESIVLNIDLLEAVYSGISIRAYSIDGRLVLEEELSELDSGSHVLELSTHDILPAGLYTVVIKGINEEELIRRVVVLP